MIKFCACQLSSLIEKTYSKEFNIPHDIMMGQRYLEMPEIGPETRDTDIDNWKNKECGDEDDLDALMCDLCNKGFLVGGDYLLEFDD